MATTTRQTADAHLVPVTVESIRVTGDPATAENVRPYLEKLFTPLTPEPERPDLSPIVEQLRARFAGAGLPVPKTSRIVVLKESDGERYLPIVVGLPEAEALALHLRGHSGPRPLSHDLMWALVEAGGARLERATITRLDPETSTFYAALTLRRGRGRAVEIDARPSDAINLAVRAGVPLFATEEVLTQAGMTAGDGEAPLAPGGRPG